jgi:hypothetical protein
MYGSDKRLLAQRALAAVNACDALGIEPADLEAKVRALVEAARKVRCEGDGVIITDDPKHCVWCLLDTALAPFREEE